MTQKRLGVLGGLGIETSNRFCSNVVRAVRRRIGKQPSLLCQIVEMPEHLEQDLIHGRTSIRHLNMLLRSIRSLDQAGVDAIAVPCNTVHVFIEPMRKASGVPVFSIIEETAKVMAGMGLRRVGLLASGTTVTRGIYSQEPLSRGIGILTPSPRQQQVVNSIISNILAGTCSEQDGERMDRIIQGLASHGAEAVILGCTDLRLLRIESAVPVIDSTEALERASIEFLLEG